MADGPSIAPGTPPTASQVVELWKRADKALLDDRRNYQLNFSFYLGVQWINWDRKTNTIRLMPDDKFKMRATINKIGSGVDSLLGRLLKRDLGFEGQAEGADDVSLRGSELGEFVLESDRRDNDWEGVRNEELFSALMGGTSAVFVEWDPKAGGSVATNPEDGSTLHLGQVRLSPAGIDEFTLEPYSRRYPDARWAIQAATLTPDQAQEAYQLPKPPAADGKAATTAVGARLATLRGGSEASSEICTVYKYFERPSDRSDGFVVIVIGDQVVKQIDSWPFPFPHLNMYPFRVQALPLRWTGTTFVSSCRSLQFQFNMVRSVALEHARMVSNARMLVPAGAMLEDSEEMSNEVGESWEYNVVDGAEPHWMQLPAYERQLGLEADRLASEIDDNLYTHATSRGQLVGSRNSGLALSLVSEKDDSPLGVLARDQALGWGRIGSMALALYEANASEQRTTRVKSPNGVVTMRQWAGADLHGQTTVTVPLDATMPHSRVATQAMLSSLGQTFPNLFANADPARLTKLLDLPDADLLSDIVDPDAKRAQWENEMLAEGHPVVPEPWHAHAKHIAEHNEMRNMPAYELLDDNAKELFGMHVTAHEKMAAEEVATQGQLEQAAPGLSKLPQADNPPGSAVPPPLSVVQGGQSAPPPGGAVNQPQQAAS